MWGQRLTSGHDRFFPIIIRYLTMTERLSLNKLQTNGINDKIV
jgi:hypothetical protein